MNIKQKIMLSAFILLFSGTAVSHAADEKAASEKPAVESEKKTPPHSHAVEKGIIPPQAASSSKEKRTRETKE